MACARCNDEGLFTAEPAYRSYLIVVCPDCDAGNRVFNFLKAIAQGTPVHIRDTAEAGFKPTGVTYPSAVLAAAGADDFIKYPTEG